MDLDDLEFSQFSFEVRFEPCYLVWDRAGRIWKETTLAFPGVRVVNAQPNLVSYRDGPLEITIEPHHVVVGLFDQSRLKEMPKVAGDFVRMVLSVLDIEEVKRIGLRLIYMKTFSDKEAAAEAVVALDLLNIPEGKYFGVAGTILRPELAFAREEKGRGFSIRVKAESVEYKFELGPQWQNIAKSINETREQLTFDVDAYLQGSILLSQIAFQDWISQTLHVIRRDSEPFLRR